ncbi:YggT family protein [Streptococcus sp. S784/96/1]|uniref:YggT family protein n=1 Tax=Streptococcus sp. S784/96/1 TaxID=2653499 RepID=UPI001386DFDF|nr:YggT family protein [Streptococcus sp. S784/96/1]
MLNYYIFSILFKVIEVYMMLLGVYVLLSWFPGAYQTRLGYWIAYFVEPLLKPFRKLKLHFGIFDVTVLVAFVALQFLRYLLMQLYIMVFTLW